MWGIYYHPPTKFQEVNVFNHVCLSVHQVVSVPCYSYPWCIGPHRTSSHPSRALIPPPLDIGPHWTGILPLLVLSLVAKTGYLFKLVHQRTSPLLVTSGGQAWGPVQTCSLQDHLPVLISGGFGKYVQLAQACGTHPTGMLSCLQEELNVTIFVEDFEGFLDLILGVRVFHFPGHHRQELWEIYCTVSCVQKVTSIYCEFLN